MKRGEQGERNVRPSRDNGTTMSFVVSKREAISYESSESGGIWLGK